jgi:hypothetical protein
MDSMLPGNLLGATDPAETTKNSFAKTLKEGFPVGWLSLFILAGGIPFPPFSYLGLGGVNLLAAGSTTWFAMKAGFQFFLTLINVLITAYFPNLWWLAWILTLNPWYIFDLLQMFSPAFAYEGYKIPFTLFDPKKPLHAKAYDNGEGGLTYAMGSVGPVVILVAAGLTCVGSYSLINMLPATIQNSWKPLMNTAFAVIGGVTAVAGGGIGGMMALPTLMGSLKSGASQVAALAPAAPSAPVQQGGGELPSLATVANNILNGTETLNQAGGGEDGGARRPPGGSVEDGQRRGGHGRAVGRRHQRGMRQHRRRVAVEAEVDHRDHRAPN